MSKISVEWLVHQEGALPLYLSGDEERFAKTEWFKAIVAKIRWMVNCAYLGDWRVDQIDALVECMTDFETINQNTFICEEQNMRRSLKSTNGRGLASRFANSFLDEDYDKATDILTEWCGQSIHYLFERAKGKAPQYFDGTWVIIAASLVATPETTMLSLKFEKRHHTKGISKKTALSMFIEEALGVAAYWGKEAKTPEDAADGAVFSLLSLIDGCKMDMPLMDIVLRPHPDDKAYCIDNDEDYFIDGMCINDEVMLHEEYCAAKEK